MAHKEGKNGIASMKQGGKRCYVESWEAGYIVVPDGRSNRRLRRKLKRKNK